MVDEIIINFKLDESQGNSILKYVKNSEIFLNSTKIEIRNKKTYYDYKH